MTGTGARKDFFISFNKADRPMATWVAWVLEDAGYSVIFQDWDFRGNFVEHMDRAHRETERTLVCLSDHYLGSAYTAAEWTARFTQDAAARDDRVVPVKVGPVTQATILDPIIHADLTGCGEEEAQRRLLARVKKAVDGAYRAKPDGRPPFPGVRLVPEKPAFQPADVAGPAPRPHGRMLPDVGRTTVWIIPVVVLGLAALLVGGFFLAPRVTVTNGVGAGGDIRARDIQIDGGSR